MTDLDYCAVSVVSVGSAGSAGSANINRTSDRAIVQCDPLAENLRMNQQCKVCGEPAAGFHFGAFTCEGCKSFFGRSYNNLSSISECKNNGCCVINKKNRTSCKACRLRKCLMVGMSKSGSRYGRRSNWFKIHCLLQEQQQQQQQSLQQQTQPPPQSKSQSWDSHPALSLMSHPDPRIHQFLQQQQQQQQQQQHAIGRTTKEDLLLMGLDEYKHSTSPSISSPESHNSDSSVEVSDARIRASFLHRSPDSKDMFLPFTSLSGFPPPFSFPPLFPPSYLYKPTPMLKTVHNINNNNNNVVEPVDVFSKRFFLDAVLQSQRSPVRPKGEPEEEGEEEEECVQENPMDLSMKACLIRERSSPCEESDGGEDITDNEEVEVEEEEEKEAMKELRSVPMDLTAKV